MSFLPVERRVPSNNGAAHGPPDTARYGRQEKLKGMQVGEK